MTSRLRIAAPIAAALALAIVPSLAVAARARPDHGDLGSPRQLHARQRPAGRGDPGSPHAGRDPDDLVQGRLRRRDAGQIGPGAFSRTSDVQGHRQASGRRIFPDRAAGRRQRERLHLDRLHRLFPARAARAAAQDDGVRGRSHDRPDPEGRERAARARRRARGIQHAGRQQSGSAADRADHGGAVSQSSLWPSGDRLAPGNREARPRGRAGVLPALLCPEQRDPGDRRRRRRRGRPPDGGTDLRRGRAAARDPGAADSSAGAGAGRAAHRDAGRPARRTAEPEALLSGSLRHHRRGRRKPGARRAGAIDGQRQQLLSLSRAGGRQAARGQRRRRLSGHLARCDAVHRSRSRRSPASSSRRSSR